MNTSTPPGPVHVADRPWEEWSKGERFGSRVRRLGPSDPAHHVGVLIEELSPGKQSCPLHYHLLEEEHLYVLEGSVTLRLGAARHTLSAGDYVCFPAGQEVGHALVNEGLEPCRYLVIGENNRNDVCVYPESNKILVKSIDALYSRSGELDYWQGEDLAAPQP